MQSVQNRISKLASPIAVIVPVLHLTFLNLTGRPAIFRVLLLNLVRSKVIKKDDRRIVK